MFFIFPKFEFKKFLILKIIYLSDYNSKSLDFVSLDSSFHQLFVDRKFIAFRVYLTLQFDVWPSTLHLLSEVKCRLSGSITFNLKIGIWSFWFFRFLWFLAFHWHINFKIWISFDWAIWRFPLRCSFRWFSDIWFSIIHSKSISYPKITNYI